MTPQLSPGANARGAAINIIDPEALWYVAWRIDGDLCGRTLAPMKTEQAADVAEKASAVYGKDRVWLERADIVVDELPDSCPSCGGKEIVMITPANPGPHGWGGRCKNCGQRWSLNTKIDPGVVEGPAEEIGTGLYRMANGEEVGNEPEGEEHDY